MGPVEDKNCSDDCAGCDHGEVLQETRLALDPFNRSVGMNLAIFLDCKTILESRIPMIDSTNADKTFHFFDPAVRISRLLRRF